MKALRLPEPRRRQSGFTLVEILVGLAIAMIGTVIMMEVLLTSDQRTRTSTAGNDALSNGAVMLHLMQRDLLQAGYGLTSTALLNNCSVSLPTGATVPLSPVVINPPTALIPAGDPNTDRLLVFYSSDSGQPEGQEVVAIAGSNYTLRSPSAFAVGDWVLGSPGVCSGTLAMARVTALGAASITVDTANAAAASVYNLGRAPRVVAYAVRNGSLTSCDFMVSDCRVNNAANWTAVGANIVSLRAQYGRDTAAAGAMDGIDLWDQTVPGNACQWARTPAVRFVLVARSSQYETKIDETTKQRVCEPVTATARTWAGSTGAPIDLTAVPGMSTSTEWQCYRYKTFETVAPARNTVWIRVPSGC